MSSFGHSLEDVRERAALYALGALDADAAHAFESHLAAGCDTCNEELLTFRAVADDLAYLAPGQLPRPQVRTRVLERIAAESPEASQPVFEKQGLLFTRSAQLPWAPGAVDGIEVKLLHHDTQRGMKTALVRMEPGSALPPHRHADVEEVYLIDGDLLVGDVLMRAGDYCRGEAGTLHHDITTNGGCLFLSTFSERNQRLP